MDKMMTLIGLMLLFSYVSANNVTEAPRKEIFEANFNSRNPGSGNTEECQMHYIRYGNAYLRGVLAPNHLSFNGSSYRDCERRCCYETSFVCRSFSYFRPLRQCFIMNLTREYQKVELINVVGYTHVQLVDYTEPTTPEPQVTTVADENDQTTLPEFWSGTTASLAEETNDVTRTTSEGADNENPAGQGTDDPDSETDNTDSENSKGQGTNDPDSKTDNTDNVNGGGQDGSEQEGSGSPSTGDENTDRSSVTTYSDNNGLDQTKTTTRGPDKGVLDESKAPEKMISNECPVSCENEGKCQFRDSNDAVATLEAYCECQDGFEGDQCENTVSDTEGFPIWIIIVIVLGSIIVILFLVVFVLYQVYRRKKGEYKVVTQIQKWARLGKKKRKVADIPDAPEAEEGKATSPTTSLQSMPNSDTSNETSRTPI